jgi:hypothetical protein
MVYSYLFPFGYLELLDSLRLGPVKQLMSWVRLYTAGLPMRVCLTSQYMRMAHN